MGRPLTELSLIHLIRQTAGTPNRTRIPLGIGDDCAILRPPIHHDLLVTTDFTLEGRHFRRDTHSPESAGHRTLARGLSDLAAMGATPLAAFLSLALPASLLAAPSGKKWFHSFLSGFRTLSSQHKVALAGGDTAKSPSEHILADIILIGTVPRNQALRRSTAKPGDLLYVTGNLGGAAAELLSLLAKPNAKTTVPSAPGQHPQLFPEPRLTLGQTLLRRKLATACMDLSDGLSTDLTHLCQASGLRAEIDEAALPIHPLARQQPDPLTLALNGGEDYELIFTAAPLTRVPKRLNNTAITCLGSMHVRQSRAQTITLNTRSGGRRPVYPLGWEHFR